jgi:hypothetical protein
MTPNRRNRYRPHPEMPGVSILTITRLHCPPEGDSRGPREIEAWMDTADVAFASKYTWRAGWHPHMSSFYVTTKLRTDTGWTTGRLHRILLAPEEPGIEVDHINGNTLDNRRSNLRLATRPENQRNRGEIRSNTSGHRGVYWDKRLQRWRVRLKVNGKNIHVGLFDDFAEACAARVAAEKLYHGAFAYSARPAAAQVAA